MIIQTKLLTLTMVTAPATLRLSRRAIHAALPIRKQQQTLQGACCSRWRSCSSSVAALSHQKSEVAGAGCVQTEEFPKDYFVFIVRTRRGLQQLLCDELVRLPRLKAAGATGIATAPEKQPTVAGSLPIAPEGFEAEGAVEIRGPWQVIYPILQSSRLAQSVWVQVTPPFKCDTASSLEQALCESRWERFLSLKRLGTLPISAWERGSRLDSRSASEVLSKAFGLVWVLQLEIRATVAAAVAAAAVDNLILQVCGGWLHMYGRLSTAQMQTQQRCFITEPS